MLVTDLQCLAFALNNSFLQSEFTEKDPGDSFLQNNQTLPGKKKIRDEMHAGNSIKQSKAVRIANRHRMSTSFSAHIWPLRLATNTGIAS
jgi:hypothetical protein